MRWSTVCDEMPSSTAISLDERCWSTRRRQSSWPGVRRLTGLPPGSDRRSMPFSPGAKLPTLTPAAIANIVEHPPRIPRECRRKCPASQLMSVNVPETESGGVIWSETARVWAIRRVQFLAVTCYIGACAVAQRRGPARYPAGPWKWWTGLDSNQRTLARADLQSAAFNHSATCPDGGTDVPCRGAANGRAGRCCQCGGGKEVAWFELLGRPKFMPVARRFAPALQKE